MLYLDILSLTGFTPAYFHVSQPAGTKSGGFFPIFLPGFRDSPLNRCLRKGSEDSVPSGNVEPASEFCEGLEPLYKHSFERLANTITITSSRSLHIGEPG